jgi:hypothetical protein
MMMAVTTSCESKGIIVNGPEERKSRRSFGFESSQFVGPDGAPGFSPETWNDVTGWPGSSFTWIALPSAL